MQSTTLVVMAAGLGTRFKQGIKQLTPVGPNGELIMDYSVHDALEAGFDHVIFVIREDIQDEFHERVGKRLSRVADIEYAFQDIEDLPHGFSVPEGRIKPWGTGQAVLACKEMIETPFAVINADDYYGKDPYVKLHDYLVSLPEQPGIEPIALAGFMMGNTLSDNGMVTRGVCAVNEKGYLDHIKETKNILKGENGGEVLLPDGSRRSYPANTPVSMNMWGFRRQFLDLLGAGFVEFLCDPNKDPVNDEYLIPIFVDQLLNNQMAEVKVIKTSAQWFGVTFSEDRAFVEKEIKELVAKGEYPDSLYE